MLIAGCDDEGKKFVFHSFFYLQKCRTYLYGFKKMLIDKMVSVI